MQNIYSLLTIAYLIPLAATQAQATFWQKTNGPFLGKVNSLCTNDSGAVLAATEAGIFISTNSGTTWNQSNQGLGEDVVVTSLALAPNGFLFAGATPGGVFISSNGGSSWEQRPPSNSFILSIVTTASGCVIAGASNPGVFRSTNNGLTWSNVQGIFMIDAIDVFALAYSQNGYVFAGGGEEWSKVGKGIFRSSDDGLTWVSANVGLSSLFVRAIAIDSSRHVLVGTSNDGVFISSDNGEHWNVANNGLTMTDIRSLIVHPNGLLFAGTEGGGIFISSNGGSLWVQKNQGLDNLFIHTLSVLPNGNIIAGTAGAGTFRSTDNGQTWSSEVTGLTAGRIWSLSVKSNGDIFAGTDCAGVYRTTNNGLTWNPANTGIENAFARFVICLPNDDILACLYYSGGVYRSTNNGETWTPSNLGMPNQGISCLCVTPEGLIFAGSDTSGIYVSEDNGWNWTRKNYTLKYVGGIACSAKNVVYAANWMTGLSRSLDSGSTWSVTQFPYGYTNTVAVDNDGTVFVAVLTSGVYRSTTNDSTWALTTAPGNACIAINSRNHIFVASKSEGGTRSDGVYRSNDAGLTWTAENEGLTHTSVYSLAVDSFGYLYAGTYGGGIYRSQNPTTFVQGNINNYPSSFHLYQNYPNPFNPSTSISFGLPLKSFVSLKIFDMIGREVASIVSEELPAGNHMRQWNALNISSGIYFYRLQAGSFIETKKLILLR